MVTIDNKKIKLQIWDTVRTARLPIPPNWGQGDREDFFASRKQDLPFLSPLHVLCKSGKTGSNCLSNCQGSRIRKKKIELK